MVENSQLPPEEVPVVEAPMEAKLIDELQKMEYEPLLPVEKKLISLEHQHRGRVSGLLILAQRYLFPRQPLSRAVET